jgi:transcriptional regulator GlxA family with amidase domain
MKSKYLFSNCEEFYPIFEKVYLKSRENLPIDQFMGEGCELFVRILFLLHNKNKTADITLEEAQRAKAFIENNIERELSMKEIADSIFRSRDYTNRIFKRYYNVTPYVYYLNLRIEKAKALLQHTSMSIQQISEKLGYKSGKCFSKQFRYMAGMTATDYRKKNHGAHRKIDE